MKILSLCAATTALLLSACGSSAGNGPLSLGECQEMAKREVDLVMSALPDPNAPGMREFMEKANASSAERCVDGDSWKREDYQCAKAATNNDAFALCAQVMSARAQ